MYSVFILFILLICLCMVFIYVSCGVTHCWKKETFAAISHTVTRTPYTNMTAVNIVAPEDMIRHVSATDSTEQCQDSCTYDDNCVGYTQDSVRKTCDLMYDITGFTSNTENLFTKRSGIKLRDFLGENKADGKYMRFENKELPPAGGGKMAAYQFINNIDDCKTKCLESRDPMSKCMAFEYDFKAKTCTINSKIDGKLGAKASKDTYAIIN